MAGGLRERSAGAAIALPRRRHRQHLDSATNPSCRRIPRLCPPGRACARGWVWLPLIFLFMLLGGALGYQLALTVGARAAASAVQDLSLSLSVKQSGDNLRLSWSRLSPAVALRTERLARNRRWRLHQARVARRRPTAKRQPDLSQRLEFGALPHDRISAGAGQRGRDVGVETVVQSRSRRCLGRLSLFTLLGSRLSTAN